MSLSRAFVRDRNKVGFAVDQANHNRPHEELFNLRKCWMRTPPLHRHSTEDLRQKRQATDEMCQECVPGLAVDGYDCDSDLDFHSDNECACPNDHKTHHLGHEHQHDHEHEFQEAPITSQKVTGPFQEVTFPSDPFFTRLINAVNQNKDVIIINDSAQGLQLTYSQFLHDVQVLRLKIQKAIPSGQLDATGSFKDGVGYVAVLAEIQYPFFVASLAILSLGGVIVPMGEFLFLFLYLSILTMTKDTLLNQSKYSLL